MMSARMSLVSFTLLLTACSSTTCSRAGIGSTEYNIETTCSGGGGIRKCISRNAGAGRIGPFEIEIEALDERGISLGRSTVRNLQGLEPQGQWEFDLVSSPSTRSVRFLRVVPK
jgi:hypothetical protein